jgi:pantetheine-phosphate adenylyltransferase
MKTKAVYPGTFDPITMGHLDVIKRGVKLFDGLVIAVAAEGPSKKPLFSSVERKKMVEQSVKGIKGVKVKVFDGLLVDFARKEKANVILRGLREMSDFPLEFQQAIVNRKLAANIETVFVMTNESHFYLSSSLVKEIAMHGGKLRGFVPNSVEKALKEKYSRTR